MTMHLNNGLHLPYFRLVLGVAALLVELIFSIMFLGQGVSGVMVISAVAFAVITDAVKVMFAGDVSYYRAIGKNDSALGAFAIVVVLMAMSVFASFWFLASNPLKGEVGLESNAAQVERLQSAVSAKQAALDKCNPTHLTKCVNPRTAELTDLQSQLSEASKKNEAFAEAAASKLFWQKTAASVGMDADNLRQGFALFRSIILELLGVVLCGQFFGNERLKKYKPVIEQEPQQTRSHHYPTPEKPVEQPHPENVVKLPTRLEKTEEQEQPEKKQSVNQ